MRAEFPEKSPTVGLNCARAIFMGWDLGYGQRSRFAMKRSQETDRAPGGSSSGSPTKYRQSVDKLDAKRTPAPTGTLDVGVVKLEPGAFDAFYVIDLHAVQIHLAHLVHHDLQPIKLIHVIGGVFLV